MRKIRPSEISDTVKPIYKVYGKKAINSKVQGTTKTGYFEKN